MICSVCKLEKLKIELYSNHYCKSCRSKYNKRWYLKNKKKHIEMVGANNRRVRVAVGAYIDRARARPCKDCGIQYDPWIMEFDHISNNKLFNISEKRRGYANLEVIQAEIDKCEVVCANCHKQRTHSRIKYKY